MKRWLSVKSDVCPMICFCCCQLIKSYKVSSQQCPNKVAGNASGINEVFKRRVQKHYSPITHNVCQMHNCSFTYQSPSFKNLHLSFCYLLLCFSHEAQLFQVRTHYLRSDLQYLRCQLKFASVLLYFFNFVILTKISRCRVKCQP